MIDEDICKCGHSKEEHNPPNSWDEDDLDDTFCFHRHCTCKQYEQSDNPMADYDKANE